MLWSARQMFQLREVTDVVTDIDVVAPDEVGEFIAARGGNLYVWVSVHHGWRQETALLEAETAKPSSDLYFRRLRAAGFDLWLEAERRVWPKTLELALRGRRVRAFWNGLGWIA